MVSCVTIAIVRNSSLGHWIKTLGDWVKTSAGSKWNMSIGTIGIGISVTKIGSISLRFSISGSLAIMISSMAIVR